MLNFCMFFVMNNGREIWWEGRKSMVYIEPATRLRTDYNRIADLARRTAEPVYITRNGTTEVVVMDIKAFQQRELVLKLGNVVLEGELKRRNGTATLSIEEMEALLKKYAEGWNCGKIYAACRRRP